tara:strand:+ start:34 stop:351 length:318 start_codon:yes stop_codon:yes gene_type:complete
MKISKQKLIQIVQEEVNNAFPPAKEEVQEDNVEDAIANSNRGRLFSHIERIPDGPQLGNVLEKLISYVSNEQVVEMLDRWFKDDLSEPENDVMSEAEKPAEEEQS